MHTPSFWHGLEMHSLNSVWQLSPMYPCGPVQSSDAARRESGGLELTSAHSHVYEAAASVQTPAPTFQRSAPNFHQPRGMAHRSGGTALMRIRRCLLRTWRRRSRECTSRGTRARWRRSALRVRTENSAQHVNGWHRARVSTARESLAPRKAQDQCFLRPQG